MQAGPPPTLLRVSTPLRYDLAVASDGSAIVSSRFLPKKRQKSAKIADPLLREAQSQVQAYFNRRLRIFDLPLAFFDGTPFQIAVWKTVTALAFGEFVSYADVARAIGRPLAHRGVAMAMGKTPLDLFVPAHRVIGADGRVKGAHRDSVRAHLVTFERPTDRRRADAMAAAVRKTRGSIWRESS
jgi:methylated-DNA-[protein]-cysteine S-methyltransferase